MSTLESKLIISLKDAFSGPSRGIMRALGGLRREASNFGSTQSGIMAPMRGAVSSLLALGAGYVGVREGITGTIGAAMKFEDAMADIRKVIDFKSPAQFHQMEQDILKMSTRLPITAEGIASIMAAAGQANIPTEELNRFTEMTAKVSTAWDISAGETGESLAKMKTALGLTVGETGLLADAINHLSNMSASSAPNLLKFSRGLSSGAMAGFKAKESLAFGGAMIGAGFEAEVAETSFRNMAKALTAGSTATKGQRIAFKELGFDAKKISKAMQKDAVGTTLKVFDAIKKMPRDEQGAYATMLFGAEARGLPALINNMDELRRMLGLVADDTTYAGSASREFEEASKRTSNALQKLKNSASAIGISLGAMALPKISEWANGFADTLNTLDQRVTVFDKLSAGAKGFMDGLGLEGGTVGAQFSKLYDLVFGRIDTLEKDSDRLGEIFLKFRGWGESIHAFGTSISESVAGIEQFLGLDVGTIGEGLGTLAGYGMTLTASAIGISIVAGSLLKLGRAIAFLTGITTAVSILKTVGKIGGILGGALVGSGAAAAGAATAKTAAAAGGTAATVGGAAKAGSGLRALGLGGLGLAGFYALMSVGKQRYDGNPERKKADEAHAKQNIDWLKNLFAPRSAQDPNARGPWDYNRISQSERNADGVSARPGQRGIMFSPDGQDGVSARPGQQSGMRQYMGIPEAANGNKEVSILGTPTVISQPSGVQQVTVTNPAPVMAPISVSVTVHATSNADPVAIGSEVANQVGQRVKASLEGLQGDTTWAVG